MEQIMSSYNVIVWEEPRPGLTKEGEEVTTTVYLHANVHDVIKMERKLHHERGVTEATDFELLQDFMNIHDAWVDKETLYGKG